MKVFVNISSIVLILLTGCSDQPTRESLREYESLNIDQELLEETKRQETWLKEFRRLSGVIEMDSLLPIDITDKYFRMLTFPPFNAPFEYLLFQ
jgi:hypothetical protein